MKLTIGRRAVAVLGVVLGGTVAGAAYLDAAKANADAPEMTVYLTPTCGCCGAWVEHMEENGFAVSLVYQNDLSQVRQEHDVPRGVTSCHMGVVGGFAVEGHVPADVVHRLLREKPAVAGIAVPGMPVGAPGMEHPSGRVDPYEVYTFNASGPQEVYEYRR